VAPGSNSNQILRGRRRGRSLGLFQMKSNVDAVEGVEPGIISNEIKCG
jgi:hypothetical protein